MIMQPIRGFNGPVPHGTASATQMPDNYPTNDWVLPDLFTTALNDNSARGLLSVNQTNYAAWAAASGRRNCPDQQQHRCAD